MTTRATRTAREVIYNTLQQLMDGNIDLDRAYGIIDRTFALEIECRLNDLVDPLEQRIERLSVLLRAEWERIEQRQPNNGLGNTLDSQLKKINKEVLQT